MSGLSKVLIYSLLLLLFVSQAQAFPNQSGSASAAPATPTAKGKVIETMNASGYTYVCLESEGQKTWAAVPATDVKVGEEVEVKGMVMKNFPSKTLGRTFNEIIFSQRLVRQ